MAKKVLVLFDRGMLITPSSRLGFEEDDENYELIKFYDELCVGDVTDAPYSNIDVHKNLRFVEDENLKARIEEIEENVKKVKSYPKDTKIYFLIYVEDKKVNETCCYYKFSPYFIGFENLNLVKYKIVVKENKKWGVSFEDYESSQIIKLSNDDLRANASKWEEIKNQKAGFIIKKNGKIESEQYEKIKTNIIPLLNRRYKPYPIIYQEFIKNQENTNYESIHFEYCLYKMIEDGIVIRSHKIGYYSGCRDIYFEQSFRLK